MGRHTLRKATGPVDPPLSGDLASGTSGNGWLSPDDREAAEKLIAETNRKMVVDAAADIAARRYGHDGQGGTQP